MRDSSGISGTGETNQCRKATSGLTARPAESEYLKRKSTTLKSNKARESSQQIKVPDRLKNEIRHPFEHAGTSMFLPFNDYLYSGVCFSS